MSPRSLGAVVPGRVELPTSTLSVWRSNQLSYRTGRKCRTSGGRLSPPLVGRGRAASSFSPCRISPQGYGYKPQSREVLNHSSLYLYRPSLAGFPLEGSRKEVLQPHLPVRLPCYDLAPITGIALGRPLRSRPSGTPGFHGLTGGVYKARERIRRAMADARLLANPASWSRVADSSPN